LTVDLSKLVDYCYLQSQLRTSCVDIKDGPDDRNPCLDEKKNYIDFQIWQTMYNYK